MKGRLAFLFTLLGPLTGICQSFSSGLSPEYYYRDEFYFIKEIAAKDLRNKNFRYEIAVKSNPGDSLSKVRIRGAAIGSESDDVLASNYSVETRQEQDWTIYTVIGQVPEGAWRLWFYSAVNGNGHFYFDDISFYVEEQAGHWRQVKVFNPSFEEKNPDIFAGYYVNHRRSPNVETALSTAVYKTGRHSLHVHSFGNEPFTPAVNITYNR